MQGAGRALSAQPPRPYRGRPSAHFALHRDRTQRPQPTHRTEPRPPPASRPDPPDPDFRVPLALASLSLRFRGFLVRVTGRPRRVRSASSISSGSSISSLPRRLPP